MPRVAIPPLMQGLTNGKEEIKVEGETLREVICNLELSYPGFKSRICDDDEIRPNIALYVDGTVSREGIRQQVQEETEIHFLPAISGGLSAKFVV